MSDSIYDYVKSSVAAYLLDPPDTDFQRRWLASLLVLAEEALGFSMDAPPFAEAQDLCFSATYKISRVERDLARSIRKLENLRSVNDEPCAEASH